MANKKNQQQPQSEGRRRVTPPVPIQKEEMAQEVITISDIAAKTGITEKKIRRILRQEGFQKIGYFWVWELAKMEDQQDLDAVYRVLNKH